MGRGMRNRVDSWDRRGPAFAANACVFSGRSGRSPSGPDRRPDSGTGHLRERRTGTRATRGHRVNELRSGLRHSLGPAGTSEGGSGRDTSTPDPGERGGAPCMEWPRSWPTGRESKRDDHRPDERGHVRGHSPVWVHHEARPGGGRAVSLHGPDRPRAGVPAWPLLAQQRPPVPLPVAALRDSAGMRTAMAACRCAGRALARGRPQEEILHAP